MIKREYWDLKQLKATKEKYQRQLARVDQLPKDYREAFQEVSNYWFNTYGGFDGFDLMDTQIQLLDHLIEAAHDGLSVQDFMGQDVQAFARDFGQAAELPNWVERYATKDQRKLNQRIQRKLGDK